jgi:uncharacterized protein (DUF1697 family)
MASRHDTYIALLRGINVGGHNKVPMAELRSLCEDLGWEDVQSYIQSGNLVFSAAGKPAALEKKLAGAIEKHFGLSVPVVVRAASTWPCYVGGNPFPAASKKEPNLVLLHLSQKPPKRGCANAILERAVGGERVTAVGDALWIHFKSGIARSKLTPVVLDRIVGSPVTARNWRTVLKLAELAEGSAE